MHPGAIVAVLIALSFTFFELYGLKRSAHLMEPPYILGQYAQALHGANLCAPPGEAQMNRFNKKYAGIRKRAGNVIQNDHPQFDATQIETALLTLEREAKSSAETALQTHGCDHKEARKLVRSFTIRAR